MTLSQVSKVFLALAMEAGIQVSQEQEIEIPLSFEAIEKLYETLLEPKYSNLPLGDIFSEYESSKKNLFRISLSVRSTNALMRAGISNLQDLGTFTLRDINDFRNLGSNSLYEIMVSYLQNLIKKSDINLGEVVNLDNPIESTFSLSEHSRAELFHITGIPEAAINFLNEISIDLAPKDLHIINARSDISEKISHREVAEDWSVTRQRIHQIENRLRNRFRNDRNLNIVCTSVVPSNTFVGVSELLELHPWLNLGVAIHPIGVSIFNILIFSRLMMIHDEWLVQNSDTPVSDLLRKIHENGISEIHQIGDEIRISEQARVYLESKMRLKESQAATSTYNREEKPDELNSGLTAADLWLQNFFNK